MTAFRPISLDCPRCGEPINPPLRPGNGKPFNVVRQCSTLGGCQRNFRVYGRALFTRDTHRSVSVAFSECDPGGALLDGGWRGDPCVHSQSIGGAW